MINKFDIKKCSVYGVVTQKYTGKAITQSLGVSRDHIFDSGDGDVVNHNWDLVKNSDYTVSYSNNKNAGAATITITGKGNYVGTITKTFRITKAKNPMIASDSTKTVKYKKVKKKAVTVSAIKVKNAQGKVTYKKSSGNKKIKVNSKNGKLKIKKGLKKGTYSVKVIVNAAGNNNYNSYYKTVTVKIKVK